MRGTRLAESEKITGITLLGRNIDIEHPIYIHLYGYADHTWLNLFRTTVVRSTAVPSL